MYTSMPMRVGQMRWMEAEWIVASGEVNASDPGFMCLVIITPMQQAMPPRRLPEPVDVVDTTAPVISLHGDANITHEAGSPYLDANASWTDAVDGSGVILASGRSQ